jgi:hypothetical protein
MSTAASQVVQLFAGASKDFIRSTPNDDGTFGGVYTGTELISWTIWPADSEAVIASLSGAPNQWLNAAQTTWLASFSDGMTATLLPGLYRFRVQAPLVGRTGVLYDGTLEVIDSPGSVSVTPPDLVSAPYVAMACSEMNLTTGQWQFLPYAITAASMLIRRWCNDRDFNRKTYTEEYDPASNGEIRLNQIPVNSITRVQTKKSSAMTITNQGSYQVIQQAWVTYTFSGDVASGQTITGLTLSILSNGTQTNQSIVFTAGMTVNTLASQINILGNNWNAIPDAQLGYFPVTELTGEIGAGAISGSSGASLYVYSDIIRNAQFSDNGRQTGLIMVGRETTSPGPKWGPDWGAFSSPSSSGRCRVTYDAGFTTIPIPVQEATAETAKAILERFKMDYYLQSESTSGAGSYAYTIGPQLFHSLPISARETIAAYRLHNA